MLTSILHRRKIRSAAKAAGTKARKWVGRLPRKALVVSRPVYDEITRQAKKVQPPKPVNDRAVNIYGNPCDVVVYISPVLKAAVWELIDHDDKDARSRLFP